MRGCAGEVGRGYLLNGLECFVKGFGIIPA